MALLIIKFFLFLSIFNLYSALPVDSDPSSHFRIVNGEDSAPHEFSWACEVHTTTNGFIGFCGCSIIGSHWILTAGHCVYDKVKQLQVSPDQVEIIAGAVNISNTHESSQQIRKAASIHLHPQYTNVPEKEILLNDIALVKLAVELELNAAVAPIRLAPQGVEGMVGHTCVTVGWGTSLKIAFPPILQKFYLNILSPAQCESAMSAFPGHYKLNDQMICAHAHDKSTCHGDSGGSLVCHATTSDHQTSMYLYGVTIFGSPNCSIPTYPTVYSSVAKFEPWIAGIISPV